MPFELDRVRFSTPDIIVPLAIRGLGTPNPYSLSKSTAIQLQFAWQRTTHLYCFTFLASKPWGKGNPTARLLFRGQKINTDFFVLKLFGHSRDIPPSIPKYPAKKFGLPGFQGTYRTFWPPPLHVEDPIPPEDIRTKKVWLRVPFSSLIFVGQNAFHMYGNALEKVPFLVFEAVSGKFLNIQLCLAQSCWCSTDVY